MSNFERLLNYAKLKCPELVDHLKAEGEEPLGDVTVEEYINGSETPYEPLNEVISYPSIVSRKEWHSFVESTINLTWEDLK